MKKNHIKLISTFIGLAIGLSTVGCSSSTSTTSKENKSSSKSKADKVSNKKDKIVWLTTGDTGAKPLLKTDRVVEQINDKLGIELVMNIAPDGNTEKINVAMASGDLPDIVTGSYGTSATQQWIDDGMLVPLNSYFETTTTLKKILEEEYPWSVAKDGNFYGLPFINQMNKANTLPSFRQDWFDNLEMKVPETLDEFKEALMAFTYNDPDGNGKDDTIGMTTTKGIESWNFIFYASGRQYADYALDSNDNVIPVFEDASFKSGMEYLKALWEAGVIDKEFMLNDSKKAEEKFYKGRAGYFTPALFRHVSRLENNLQQVYPEGKLGYALPPKGSGEAFGCSSQGKGGMFTGVTVNCKVPEKAVAFIDFMNSEEGTDLLRKGIEGIHYTMDGETIVYNEEERAKDNFSDNGWAHPLAWGSFAWPLESGYLPDTEPAKDRALESIELATQAQVKNLIPNKLEAEIKNGSIVGDIYEQYFLDMMQGKVDIDQGITELSQKWRTQGGEEILQQANEIYKANK